jgi:hypothetical protein
LLPAAAFASPLAVQPVSPLSKPQFVRRLPLTAQALASASAGRGSAMFAFPADRR